MKRALNETKAPPEVDTLRDDICPVCGETDSYNGDKCMVCGFEKPPSMFMDPDTQVAQNMDLRQDQNSAGGGELGDLVCPVCGESFSSAAAMDEDQDPHLAPAAQSDGSAAVDDLPPEEGELPEPTEDDDNPTLDPPPGDPEEDPPVGKPGDEPEDLEEDAEDVPFGQDEPQAADDEEQDPNAPPGDVPPGEEDPSIDPMAPEEDPDAQYETDQDAEQQTGYEAGDICPNCGQGVLQTAGGNEAGIGGNPTAPGDPDAQESIPGQEISEDNAATPFPSGNDEDEESVDDEDVPPSDDDENDDEETEESDGDDEDASDFIKKKQSHNAVHAAHEGVQVVPNPKNPAAQQRSALRTALNQQAKVLRNMTAAANQERLLRQASEARTATLEQQMLRLASLAGADADPVLRQMNEQGFRNHASLMSRAASIKVVADERDPAQPVPEPAAQAPVVTEQEAAQPAARADVGELGATPITDVSADATVAVDQPYGTIAFEPLNLNEVDVTAPVEGTQGHLPPEQTTIPVEVRVGDPDRPEPAFGWTLDQGGPGGAPGGPVGGSVGTGGAPVPTAPGSPAGRQPGTTASNRTFASLRLARLRMEAGTEQSRDDILVAQAIADNHDLSDQAIHNEIKTLSSVLQAQASRVSDQPEQRTARRNLVPRSSSPAPAPSMVGGGDGPIQAQASIAGVNDTEFLFE